MRDLATPEYPLDQLLRHRVEPMPGFPIRAAFVVVADDVPPARMRT